ncbi:MAG: AAA family ATPase [Candidatus Diapherotrites archaeon]|jgi:adenylate kinase|uniref:AAA family ATPase n=1 Tax=Candidatus Iainarchaeum sp. TaxID=3101447 RepID=A0A8T5GEK7_9ARCH|nr:AAA family ATPase [Candidatus Diapherotrites archaeon]MBT7241690.1 AAA family ATPase [Candidatus Diapherotrites archaeon]
MNIAISGTPGVGKTTIAKLLGKKLNLKVINEKDFALKKGIGSFNEMDELEIPIDEFEKTANALLLKEGNIIFEGHLLCEMKLKVDKFIVLTLDPEKLQLRLELRNYPEEKIMDNTFCEGIEYCKKHAKKNYKTKLIVIESKEQNELINELLDLLN